MSLEHLFETRDPEKIKQATICLIVKTKDTKTKILLAMKKRGFGAGFYNGPGGKPKPGESIENAATREVKEEVDIDILTKDLVRVGLLHFYFPIDKKDWDQDVHVFMVKNWKGVPKESEEMKPEWFEEKNFPYNRMWPDDLDWMPPVLSGRKVEAWFIFDNNQKILRKKIIDLK